MGDLWPETEECKQGTGTSTPGTQLHTATFSLGNILVVFELRAPGTHRFLKIRITVDGDIS